MTLDPGLQPQRTALAWTRTGIAASALAGLLVRGAYRSGSTLAVVAAVAGILGTVVVFCCGSRGLRPVRRRIGTQAAASDYNGIRMVTAVVIALGVLTASTVVVG